MLESLEDQIVTYQNSEDSAESIKKFNKKAGVFQLKTEASIEIRSLL